MSMARRVENSGMHDDAREGILMRLVHSPAGSKRDNVVLWGIAGLIITSIIGWYFLIAPTSMFGFVPVGYIPLHKHLIINAIIWMVSCALPFVFAVAINRKTNVTELFGRMLYAHWPVMLLMLPAIMGDTNNKIQYATFMKGLNSYDLATTMEIQPVYSKMMLVVVVILLVWYLYWSYLAFTKSTGRGGKKIFAIFVVVMCLSQILTDVTLTEVYNSVLG